MKKYLAFILGICIFFSNTFVFAEPLTTEESSDSGTLSLFAAEGGKIYIEAEAMTLDKDVEVFADTEASGGKAVKVIATADKELDAYTDSDTDCLNVTVSLPEIGQYAVWMRVKATNSSSDSMHYSLAGRPWVTRNYDFNSVIDELYNIVGQGYQWVKLGVIPNSGGTAELRFRYREPNFILDKLYLTNDLSVAPTGVGEETKAKDPIQTTAYWPVPQIKPIEGHPRLFVTQKYVDEHIKPNLNSPEWQYAYALIKEQGNDETLQTVRPDNGTKGNYSSSIVSRLRARAMLWLLGDVNEEHAQKTIQYTKEYLSTVSYPNVGDITRSKGDAMVMAAIVYDWCYSLLTDTDKQFFIDQFKYMASIKESHYPPVGTGHQIGEHDGEGEIFKDLLSAGVAVYDEDEEIYNLAAGRMFDKMIESRNVFYHAGRNYNGTSYGIERTRYESYAALIFDRMGYADLFDRDETGAYRENGQGNLGNMPYTWLYERLPFGLWMKEGNSWLYSNYTYENGYSTADAAMMLNVSGIYDDPYIRGQWVKELALSGYSLEPFWNIVFGQPDRSFETNPDDLPLTRVNSYPMTHIEARTNWQDAVGGETVVAKMLAYEKLMGEHEHMDLGSFSIYYKGSLTMDGGRYNGETGGWFGDHFMNYMHQSIASNTMTVYDPIETFTWRIAGTDYTIASNGGGQKNQDYIKTIEDFWATPDLAETQGLYVGPNETTPEFSYVKTDLTNAYSDKIADYKRSMVFLNLFDEDYPAAMVVYDNLTTSNPSYKKSFLLQSIEEPTVEGNKSVIARTEDGFTGKLINITMLPKNPAIEKVGGEGYESWVNGKNYPNLTPGVDDEQGAWRLEISPAEEAANNDLFLNAMYVSDGADKSLPELEMIQETFEHFVGATIKDRMVLFSKTGEPVSETTTVNLRDNGAEEISCLLTDIEEGVWKVTGGGMELYTEVKEGENALYFKGAPGEYTLTKAEEGQTATAVEYPETKFAKSGDFLLYYGKGFLYQAKPTKLIDGVPYLPMEEIFGQLGAEVSRNESDQTIEITKNDNTLTVQEDSLDAVYNEAPVKLKHPPVLVDGVWYGAAEDYRKILSCRFQYDDYAGILQIYDTPVIEGIGDQDPVPAGTELTLSIDTVLPAGTTASYYVNGVRMGEVRSSKLRYVVQGGVNEIEVRRDDTGDAIFETSVTGINYQVEKVYHEVDFENGTLKGESGNALRPILYSATGEVKDGAYTITNSGTTAPYLYTDSAANDGPGVYMWQFDATYDGTSAKLNSERALKVRYHPTGSSYDSYRLIRLDAGYDSGAYAKLQLFNNTVTVPDIKIYAGDTYTYKAILDTINGKAWIYLDGKLVYTSDTKVAPKSQIGEAQLYAGVLDTGVSANDTFDDIRMYKLTEAELADSYVYTSGGTVIDSLTELSAAGDLRLNAVIYPPAGTTGKANLITAVKRDSDRSLVWAKLTPMEFAEGESGKTVEVTFENLPEDIAEAGYTVYHYLWGGTNLLTPLKAATDGLL